MRNHPQSHHTLLYFTQLGLPFAEGNSNVVPTVHSSDPEGNFRGNQLQGRSMSLSPLYTTLTNDLHVSTGAGVHRSFPRLHHSGA